MIECHCILPQFKNRASPPYHKFVVFSTIDDSDTAIPKYAQCNNCDVVHKVFDICKSEIISGKDELRSITSKNDLSLVLSPSLVEVLKTYNADVPTWEQANFIISNRKWGQSIILSKDTIGDDVMGKRLVFESIKKFKLEEFLDSATMGKK